MVQQFIARLRNTVSITEQDRRHGHWMGAFVALSFGSVYPISKPIVDVVDPYTFSTARYALAGVVVMLVALAQGQTLRITWRDALELLGLGLIGYTLFQGVWAVALSLTTPSKGVVLLATAPVFGAVLATLGGDRLSPMRWSGIALAFAGVFVLINNSVTEFTLGGGHALGDMLFVLAAFSWALFGALSRPAIMRLGTLRVTAWCAVFGSAALLPLAVPGMLSQDWAVVDGWMMLGFLHAAIIVGGVGVLAWTGGLARLGLAGIVVYLYLSPVVGVTLSGLLLGQWLSVIQLCGAAAVLGGVLLSQKG